MKIDEFIPDIVNRDAKLIQANEFLKNNVYNSGFNAYAKAYGVGNQSQAQAYGVEQLYWEWLRTAYAYRRMFIQDLYLLAFDSTEIRTPLLHLRNQVFKKGFEDWKPSFKLKCIKCDKEFHEKVIECDKCGGTKFREPDPDQYKNFNNFRINCNTFGQSLEEILKTCLVPGTKILTRKGKNNFCYQSIENIAAGTKVWTHTGKLHKVTEIMSRQVNEELVVLYLENGEIVKLTSNHRVYAKTGWKRADELTTSDILLKLAEVHPTWSNNLSMGIKKVSDRISEANSHPRSLESIERQKNTVKTRKDMGVIYAPAKGHHSEKKGKTNIELYGLDKALEISERSKRNHPHLRGINNPTFGTKRPGVGKYFRAKIGNFNGANNPNWKNGLSYEPYDNSFNVTLKKRIFARDNSTCQICGQNRMWKKLDSHHIDYVKKNSDEINLISLCPSCHTKTNYNRERWQGILKAKVIKKYAEIHNGTKILKIAKEHYSGIVYNLEVEDDHSYVGKGIIYHNCEDDVNMIDDAYILLNKQYIANGKLYGRVIEIRRIHPALVEIDLDKSGLPKNSHWICLFHRDNIQINPGICDVDGCHQDLVPAMYIYNHRGRRIYLPEDEMIHISKFSPSETYGYSILLTIMQKVLTLTGMDRFLYRYFFERKVPTGMIMTGTDDPQSLEIERQRVESKMADDPTYIPWVAVSQRTGRGRTDFIRLFNTLQEMDYLPVRNEIRDRIAAAYGVPQMYMNVLEGIGGLSGQTQQLKVFNDVIQADQRIYNEKVFPILMKAFGITDWTLNLRPPEEKVEGQILQIVQQRVVIAGQMLQMGFDVELKPECKDTEVLDFNYSGKAQTPVEMQEEMMESQMADQAQMGNPSMTAAAGSGAPNMEANGEREPYETGAPEAVKELPVWQRALRNEDNAVRDDDMLDKPEKSDQENQPFENNQ